MLNNVILIGRLTKDIELRQTSDGRNWTSFSLAVNRPKNKDGNKETDFIQCKAFNKTAELLSNYIRKGSLISVTGSIQTSNYTDQSGQQRYTTDVIVNNVVFLDSKKVNNPFENQFNNQSSNQFNNQRNNNQIDAQDYFNNYQQPSMDLGDFGIGSLGANPFEE